MISTILTAVLVIVVAPIIGGLVIGIDRRLTARFQNRFGPPILQPFYDVVKLMGKENILVNQTQMVYVWAHLLFAVASLLLLVLKQDLLVLIFVQAFSTICLILGAMSVRSPYSKIGAQRELIQMLSAEPILLIMVLGVYMTTKSFMIESIFEHPTPLLFSIPLVFFAFLYVLTIKLHKSPFDFSTSHHGHQEIIKGVTTEFSGSQLAVIELAHWYDLIIHLGLIALFFANPLWVGIVMALGVYSLEIVVDNISARMTWQWMLKVTCLVGTGSAGINIIWLYLKS